VGRSIRHPQLFLSRIFQPENYLNSEKITALSDKRNLSRVVASEEVTQRIALIAHDMPT
jgi:hypothetical protein